MPFDIDKIRLDGNTQPRSGLNEDVIGKLIDDLKAGDTMAPVVVFYDGHDYWLADGFHRIEAHRRIGKPFIEAEVHKGSARDAFLLSLKLNDSSPLTVTERKHAAERMLRDDEWSKWSDREIGRKCGLDHVTVSKARRKLSGENHQMSQPPAVANETDDRKSRIEENVVKEPSTETTTTAPKEPAPAIVEKEAKTARKVKATRNGKDYEVKVSTRDRTKGLLRRVSIKAWAIMKNTAAAQDPKQKKDLQKLTLSMQILVAKRLRDGESETVTQAAEAILGGAPVTKWEKAYEALLDLDTDDRARMCRMVLSETEQATQPPRPQLRSV